MIDSIISITLTAILFFGPRKLSERVLGAFL
jgi:hypothetical protein